MIQKIIPSCFSYLPMAPNFQNLTTNGLNLQKKKNAKKKGVAWKLSE